MKKIGSAIYLIILVGIVISISLWINNEKKTGTLSVDNSTDEENCSTANLSEDDKNAMEKYNRILDEIYQGEVNGVYHRGEYPNCADSRELNTEFITDGYILSDPIDGYEIEFLTYEELPNLVDYNNTEGIIKDVYSTFKERVGALNSDGTLNTITFRYEDRLNDGVYGDEYIIEDYEYVVVKIGVKLKNTENKVNDIYTLEFLRSEAFIYMDDGKLYRNTSVYHYDFPESTFTYPIYHSFMNKVYSEENVFPSTFTLEPYEEVEGEIIYLVGKKDMKDLYLKVNPGSTNIENFNGVYISFMPFTNLMKLPSKK